MSTNEYQTLKDKFFENPKRDPRNPNKKIYYGKGPYNKLVAEFGDPTQSTAKEIKDHNISLPDDVIREILYLLPFEDIKTFCITQKYQHICNDASFWKIIFEKSNLPIIGTPQNAQEWIDEYKKIYNAYIESELLLNNKDIFGIIANIIPNNSYISVLTIFDKTMEFPIKVEIFRGMKGFLISYDAQIKTINLSKQSKQYTLNILIQILYYYPNIILYDNNKEAIRKKDISSIKRTTTQNKILKYYKQHNF
jgi:hypothetical protein